MKDVTEQRSHAADGDGLPSEVFGDLDDNSDFEERLVVDAITDALVDVAEEDFAVDVAVEDARARKSEIERVDEESQV